MGEVAERCNTGNNAEETMQTEGSSAYSLLAFSKMNVFRKRGQLCDVVIKVGGQEFLAHRVVLAATSDYFDAMFSNGMAESAQLEVELKSISPTVMDALLDYVYTGQVHVTMENVQDLLPAASLVQMEGVKTACSNFLLAEVDASNVLGIRRFAELHSCAELEEFARNYAAHNFETVTDHEEFLFLNHEELLDLVTREDLHIDSEESVYMAVMRWIYHQVKERSPHLPVLLQNIRLSVLSVRFLTDVVDKDQLIRQSLKCRDMVDDAKRFHLRPDLRHEMRERRYRQRDGGDEYLVVIGGFGSDQNPSDSVEMFNPRTLAWTELPDLPISFRYVAACSLDTCVYVIGGFDGRERLNTVCLLDIAHREEGWRWLTSMHYKRGLSAACTHKGLIYVCGGFDGQSRLRSLEVYHPKIDEWRILEDMTTAREGAGLVVVDETLYCLGGYDGFHLLNSMEAFDLGRGTWSMCKPMYMRRSGAGCALLGDTIYVCGGYGGAEGRGPLHLDTVEAYNTRLAQWTLVTSMNLPRCYVGACPLAGKIYVAAGYNGSRLLDTVESYDPIENIWWLHDGRMNHERCDTGMCVVRFLSCAEPFNSPSAPSTSRGPPSVSTGSGAMAAAALPSASNIRGQNSTQPGSCVNQRPSSETSTNSYRIPMLPLPTHLRERLSSLFRPNPETHAAFTGQLTGARPITTLTHSRPGGVPSSTALSVGQAASRDTTSQANVPNSNSLRVHPHLPVRHHTNPVQNSQLLPAPGCVASGRDLSLTRVSTPSFTRTTRQLLAVAGSVPACANRGPDHVFNPVLSEHHTDPAASSVTQTTSLETQSDSSPSEQQPPQPLPEDPASPFLGTTADGDSVAVGSGTVPIPRANLIRLSSALNLGVRESTPTATVTCDHVSPARRLISSHPDSRALIRGSHSSSPPCLSRIMYHSAPETGSSSCSLHPHPVDELFRSAEALDFLVTSDYRFWLEGACGGGDVGRPGCSRESVNPPLMNELPPLSSSNSETSGLELGFRTLADLNMGEDEMNGEDEEELEEERAVYENETFDANNGDTRFHYVHLDAHLAEADPGRFSDAPSSASDAEFENGELHRLTEPELRVPHSRDLSNRNNRRLSTELRPIENDHPIGSSMVSSSCSELGAALSQTRHSLPPQPIPTSSARPIISGASTTQDSLESGISTNAQLAGRSGFRAFPVSATSTDPSNSEPPSCIRPRVKIGPCQSAGVDQRWPHRLSTEDRQRACGQNAAPGSLVSPTGDAMSASVRLMHPVMELFGEGNSALPGQPHSNNCDAQDHATRITVGEADPRVHPTLTTAPAVAEPDSGLAISSVANMESGPDGLLPTPLNSDSTTHLSDQSLSATASAYVVRAADSTHVTDDSIAASVSVPNAVTGTPGTAPDQSTATLDPAPETRSDGEGEEEEDGGEELNSISLRSGGLNEDDGPERTDQNDPGLRQQNQAVGQTDSSEA